MRGYVKMTYPILIGRCPILNAITLSGFWALFYKKKQFSLYFEAAALKGR
jgi:hypothetical protein